MREIEVKAHLQDVAAFTEQLTQQDIELSTAVRQHDRVFGLPDTPGAHDNHAPWLRIRVETAGNQTTTFFTFKRSVSGQLDSIEHELAVTDEGELEKIILQLGFEPYSDITKTRQKAHLGDVELCLDHVDTLGDFVEAELLCADDADLTATTERLWEALAKLGVDRSASVTDGYDVLVNRALGRD